MGVPNGYEFYFEPTKNTFFDDKPLKFIETTSNYTFAMTETDELYVFGSNNKHQLGWGNKDCKIQKFPLKFNLIHLVSKVKVYSCFSMILTGKFRIFIII